MKKLLGISLVAALAVSPMMASAADGDPTHADNPVLVTNAQNQTVEPGYALVPTNVGNEGNFATAGYVKGAYNAAIKAINTVDSMKQDNLSQTQLNAVNSGITSDKVSTYDSYATGKQDTIDSTHKLSASLVDGLATVATSGNASDLTQDETHRLVTDDEKSTWSGKQAALTETQLAAVNSGITQAKREAYDDLVTASGSYATQTGVENTVKGAIYQTTLAAGSTVTGAVTVPTQVTVNVMEDWASGTATSRDLSLSGSGTANLTGGTVESATLTTTATAASYNATATPQS